MLLNYLETKNPLETIKRDFLYCYKTQLSTSLDSNLAKYDVHYAFS